MRKRKMVMLPGSRVYHRKTCWHLRHSKRANWIYIRPEKAEQKGCRACKCCAAARFPLAHERGELDRFIEGKDMAYKLRGDAMYVKTDISCWKLLYSPKKGTYAIYHRNSSPAPVDFAHPEREQYHFQQDKPASDTALECFQYIRSHDVFRKAEAGGRLNLANVSPRYRQQMVNRSRRQARRRLDALFAALERENPEYRKLAYC